MAHTNCVGEFSSSLGVYASSEDYVFMSPGNFAVTTIMFTFESREKAAESSCGTGRHGPVNTDTKCDFKMGCKSPSDSNLCAGVNLPHLVVVGVNFTHASACDATDGDVI